MAKVKKALIPAAGLGTRLLPATKVVPKELFPIWNRPAIEYIVDELIESGIEEIVFVLHPSKQSVFEHFLSTGFVELSLKSKGKLHQYPEITKYKGSANFRVCYQEEAKGLGHAVSCGETEIGDHPFVVVLPDDLILSQQPNAKNLIQSYDSTGKYSVLLQKVPIHSVSSYGIVSGSWDENQQFFHISDLIEKPALENAPSDYAVVGRYLLPASIFDILNEVVPGSGGEIQLTDALRVLAQRDQLVGVELDGDRLDIGQPQGFLEANLKYALKAAQDKNKLKSLVKDICEHS